MEVPRDPAASRYEHAGKGLRRSDLARDPVKQFGNWFTSAIEAGIHDVNAMSLATAGSRWQTVGANRPAEELRSRWLRVLYEL